MRVQGINRSIVDGKGCGTSHRLRMNADLKGYRLVTSQAFFDAEMQAGRQELAVLHLADTILCGGIDETGDAPKRPGSQCVLRQDSATQMQVASLHDVGIFGLSMHPFVRIYCKDQAWLLSGILLH